MWGMDTDLLFLPGALVTAPFGVLLLDKALKRARAEGIAVRGVALPEQRLPDARLRNRFVAEAALNGLPCVFVGETPQTEGPYQAFVGGRALDLRLPGGLHDWHAHTQFAYCGRGIDLAEAAHLALTLGVASQGFSEHAFALYFGPDALKFRWQGDEALVGRTWAAPGRGRMAAYRAWVADLRALLGPRVRFGLEVDLCCGGRFCLAPEDREGWDYLIGAVHEVEGLAPGATQAEVEAAWMRDVERLLAQPIRILAHPFRYFPWSGRPTPAHLYRPVARMLAQAGVAAEINHHKNPFDLAFFRICLEEGVTLSLGTDAHVTRAAGDLLPHLRTLAELGLAPDSPHLLHP